MNFKTIIFLMLFFPAILLSQESLLFKTLCANVFEPRIGSFYQFSDEKLRLDIGTSLDLYNFDLEGNRFSIGADFFTYTRLRSESNFKFPVETTDFFFGANLNWLSEKNFSGRLRLAHISSHLSDGFAKDSIFFKAPFVFSREFVDLVFAYRIEDIRPYIGMNCIFSTQPKDVSAFNPQIGFDYEKRLCGLLSLVCGYDFKLIGIAEKYMPSNAAQAGLKLHSSEKTALLFSLYYYEGRSFHGLFYKEMDSYVGLGFQLVFF
ncbi:MAG: DUF1207 domain-containing protein [Ignavibacteria bacterium]|nr:DUF1207 domain-containing protein [Ignavibacteria bacterium]